MPELVVDCAIGFGVSCLTSEFLNWKVISILLPVVSLSMIVLLPYSSDSRGQSLTPRTYLPPK